MKSSSARFWAGFRKMQPMCREDFQRFAITGLNTPQAMHSQEPGSRGPFALPKQLVAGFRLVREPLNHGFATGNHCFGVASAIS